MKIRLFGTGPSLSGAVLAGAILSLPVAAAVPKNATVDPAVIQLAPFNVKGVRALPPPESWHYARVDGLEVLANGSLGRASRLLDDFQKFRQALAVVFNDRMQSSIPLTLIFCGQGGAFADFTPDGKEDYRGVISYLVRDRAQATLTLNLAIHTYLAARHSPTAELDGEGASDLNEREVEHDRQLYREYARFLLTQGETLPPPWLLEGRIQVIMDMEFRGRVIHYGKLDVTKGATLTPFLHPYKELDVTASATGLHGGRTMEAGTMIPALSGPNQGNVSVRGRVGDRPFPLALAGVPLMPLEEFFAVAADSPAARNPLSDDLWAKQAYAFVHMCQFRADGKWLQPFETFVRRLSNEALSESLFRECFQLSYAEMLKELRAYIRYPRHRFRDILLTKESRLVAEDVQFREASQGEIARIKGDAQQLAGLDLDALATYRVAYARGERDAGLLAALGVAEHRAGHPDRARECLEAAAKLGTERPSAWATLARLRLEAAKAAPAAAGKLSASQMAAIIELLQKARTLQPALPETYAVMADAWAVCAVPPTPGNVHLIGEGVMKFPYESNLAFQTAQLYVRAGDGAAAAGVARRGLRFATDEAARTRFADLLASLPVPSPTPSDGTGR